MSIFFNAKWQPQKSSDQSVVREIIMSLFVHSIILKATLFLACIADFFLDLLIDYKHDFDSIFTTRA